MSSNDLQVNIPITAEDMVSVIIDGITKSFTHLEQNLKEVAVNARPLKTAFEEISDGAARLPLAFNQIIQAAGTMWQSLVNFAQPALAMETLNAQFKVVSGNSQLAAKDLSYVKDEANRLGMNLQDTANSFIKFATATKNTSMEGETAKKMFSGFSEGFKALGLSSQNASGALMQISQGLNKGKVQLEDMNIVAENGIPIYEMLATAMGKSKPEIMDMISAGTLLANDVYPKLGEEMHKAFGADASAMAGNTAAQLERFKNSVFELTAVLGGQLTGAISAAASFFTGFATAIKDAIAWIKNDAWGQGVGNILSGLGLLAAALGTAAIGYQAYTIAATIATAATAAFETGALMAFTPFLPLIAAASAAIIGLAAGLSALASLFDGTGSSAQKSGEAMLADLEAKRKATAEKTKIEEEYQKAVGVSVDKQLKNQTDLYLKELTAINQKWDLEEKSAGGNAARLKDIAEKRSADISKIDAKDSDTRRKILEEESKNQEKWYSDGLKLKQAYYEALGKVDAAKGTSQQIALDNELKAVRAHYDQLKADAHGNAAILTQLADKEGQDIAAVKERHSQDMLLRVVAFNEQLLAHTKAANAAIIAEIQQQVDTHVITEEEGRARILAVQIQQTKDYLEQARLRAQAETAARPGSEQYKIAIDAIKTLEATLTGQITAEYKAREKARTDANTQHVTAHKIALDQELIDLQTSLTAGALTEADYRKKKLQAELDAADAILAVRQKILAETNPNDLKAYQDALTAKVAAEKEYTDKSAALKQIEKDEISKLSTHHKAEQEKRAAAESTALQVSRDLSTAWSAIWDAAYNSATTSLQKMSDAAYNAFAAMYNLPLKMQDSISSLSDAATKAGRDFITMYQSAMLPQGVSAAWVKAYQDLGMISVNAKQIEADFLNQKVAALTLADALDAPVNATRQFVDNAQNAIRNMNLLDNSTLNKLNGAIDKVKQAMLTFTEKISGALKALQDEWDNMSMTKLELEDKRYNEQRAQWQKDYALAQQQNNQIAMKELNDQLDLMIKIHAVKAGDAVASKAPGMASGGNVGGSGIGDTQLRWLDPREWVMRPEASSFWGSNIMAAMNAPWSLTGRQIADRIAGATIPDMSIPVPRLAMATGGPVGELRSYTGSPININISVPELNEATVRREIIPVLERYSKLRG